MDILFLLIPLSVALVFFILGALWWAVHRGQFEDIEAEGERADEHPRRYTRIVVRHIASGEGLTPEALERAAHLSHEKYCSVAASLVFVREFRRPR